MAVFIERNRYGANNNIPLGGGIRAISRDFNVIDDPTIHLFIEPNQCGIKDENGNILFSTEGDTTALKPHYSYNICVHKRTKEVSLFVESGINIPFYLPLKRGG